MKHFEIKNLFGGAGGKKPKSPKPPTLTPPNLGDYKSISSYSYSEVVDLLSDGPIEGLTNKDGYVLEPSSYLQGVYLNDVPVEVSANDFLTLGKKTLQDFEFSDESLIKATNNFAKNLKDLNAFLADHWTMSRTNEDYQDCSNDDSSRYQLQYHQEEGKTTTCSTIVIRNVTDDSVSENGYQLMHTKNINHGLPQEEKFDCEVLSDQPKYWSFTTGDLSSDGYDRIIKNRCGSTYYPTLMLLQAGEQADNISRYMLKYRLGKSEPETFVHDRFSAWSHHRGEKGTLSTAYPGHQIAINAGFVSFIFGEGETHYFDSSLTETEFNYIPQGPAYWSKQMTGSMGEETYYTEFCISYHPIRFIGTDPANPTNGSTRTDVAPMFNTQNETGHFRHKIDEGIDKLMEINSSPDYSRYTKDILRDKLEALGYKGNQFLEKGKIIDVIQSSILKFDEVLDFRGEYLFSELGPDSRVDGSVGDNYDLWHQLPYLFLSIDEEYIIDGYDQELHEKLFENPKYSNIKQYDPSIQYSRGDIFFDIDKYYQVLNPWNGDDEGITPAFELEEINPKLSLYRLDEPEILWNRYFDTKGEDSEENNVISESDLFDLIIPILDNDKKWNGKVKGFNIQIFRDAVKRIQYPGDIESQSANYTRIDVDHYDDFGPFDGIEQGFFSSFAIRNVGPMQDMAVVLENSTIDSFLQRSKFGVFERKGAKAASLLADKFNYSNVLMEFRRGDEIQNPLGFFKDIHIDHYYEDVLLGPFSTSSQNNFIYTTNNVQLIKPGTTLDKGDNNTPDLNFDSNSVPDMDENFLIAYEETSRDVRLTSKSFSDWDNSRDFDESAQPVTHIIENPNVKSCFISLWVKQLSDMFEKTQNGNDAGSKKPTVLNIRIETGLVEQNGNQIKYNDRFFQIVALIESPVIIDLGSADSQVSEEYYTDVRELNPFSSESSTNAVLGGLYTPFDLPEIEEETITNTEFTEDRGKRRYLKVTKLSTETESSLVRKDVDLLKVTEVIESTCTYPLSALIGIKTDSRVFGEIPSRTYKCKLKKVKVPSNYFPIQDDGKDKRYYNTVSDFELTSINDRKIYRGDWDGSFKNHWTDNPAWVLYDMLTSPRYGLGDQINQQQVNKWDLYKIARFCDAVNEEGEFIGVSDGRGGIEPRFSCNILFSKGINVFDAINSISAIFRGVVYFENSSINFSDDRLKEPIALFTNSNVKDGFFAYSSARRDQKYNAVEVSYKDKRDSFKSKIEYIENEEDIRKRGLFKKEIIAVGITSKAMAIRAAKHVMYQTTKEDETISFVTSTEALLCKPGDLVVVEDDLKTLNSNFGRVLQVDHTEGSIRTSETFQSSEYNNKITLYIPSGNKSPEDLDSLANEKRLRLSIFDIVGGTSYSNFDENFTGVYKFSEYSEGYSGETLNSEAYSSYPVYTGDNTSNPVIWFDIYSTGWVFSTGQGFTESNDFNKFITSGDISDFSIITSPVGDDQVSKSSGWLYDSNLDNNRGSNVFSFSGSFLNQSASDLDYFGGVLDREIEISSAPQIRTFNVTGWGGYEGIQSKEYGDIVYIDQNDVNYNLIKFVPEGTTYRFESRNYNDQVYKVQSIKEEENHSFNIIANKYDSGKYSEIEDEISIEKESDVFGYNQLEYQVNDIKYVNLQAPTFDYENTGVDASGNYQISLGWTDIDGVSGYNVSINSSQTNSSVNTNENNIVFTIPEAFNTYTLKIRSLADVFNNNDYNTRYRNSDFYQNIIDAGNIETLTQEFIEPEGGEIG